MTTDEIIDYLTQAVENKLPINPTQFLDAAVKLNVLLGGEQDRFFELQQAIAQAKALCLKEGESVKAAEVHVQVTDLYKEMQKQAAKMSRIIEFIRLAKVQARLRTEELKGY